MTSTDPMVTAQWLKEHINAPDVCVVDASWVPPWMPNAGDGVSRSLYKEAHIPGAVFFDIDEIADTDSSLPHMLPSPEKFSSRVRKMGLGDGKTIVVYDRSGFMASARVWWMFRFMGHADVKVLDGGWNAWIEAGGAVEDMEPVLSERHHTVRVQNHLLKTFDQMQSAVKDDTTLILDARPPGRFVGNEPEPRPGLSSGHMPGSQSLPATSLVNSDGTLKSEAELREALAPLKANQEIVATCGSGVSAAIILLAFQRIGRNDVALYDGSWSEWAEKCPNDIATA